MINNGFILFNQDDIVIFRDEGTTEGCSDLTASNYNNFHEYFLQSMILSYSIFKKKSPLNGANRA